MVGDVVDHLGHYVSAYYFGLSQKSLGVGGMATQFDCHHLWVNGCRICPCQDLLQSAVQILSRSDESFSEIRARG